MDVCCYYDDDDDIADADYENGLSLFISSSSATEYESDSYESYVWYDGENLFRVDWF